MLEKVNTFQENAARETTSYSLFRSFFPQTFPPETSQTAAVAPDKFSVPGFPPTPTASVAVNQSDEEEEGTEGNTRRT